LTKLDEKGDTTMTPTIGIFSERTEAERAIANLRAVGVSPKSIRVLVPGASDTEPLNVPTSEAEQPGMGKAIGGVLGGAVGAATGAEIGAAAAASALVPVAGPAIAIGLVGAVLLSFGGAAAGGALEHNLATGLPKDELFVYEDALRRGRTIVVVMTADANEREQAVTALEASGAESVDAARKQWWIGLRDAEALEYRAEGFDFERDEATYRQGFEAALSVSTRGRADRDVATYLEERYPDSYRTAAFRRGYDRGRAYHERLAAEHLAHRR
jgi:hypothetical protein